MGSLLETIRFWFDASRYLALPQSILAGVVAVVIGLSAAGSNLWLGILALVGVAFAHLGVNLLDDYFDYKSGAVEARMKLANGGMRSRIGKCNYLLNDSTSLKSLFIAASVFCLIACAIGAIIFYYRGFVPVIIAAIAAVLGYFYSAPPVKLSYRGFSEISVGIMFGPLLMSGVYYCVTGDLNLRIFLISIPMGLLIFNILHIHSIMDYEPDIAAGKKTLTYLLGSQYRGYALSIFVIALAYLSIFCAIALSQIPILCAAVVITLPMAIELIKLMKEFVTSEESNLTPKFWMGPMENWQNIKDTGIEWFMIRWYLARNLTVAFAVVICITYHWGVKFSV